MDLLTHIAAGTIIGELTLSNKAGKKALYWGAFSGIIPDMDLFAYPFLETTQALLWHRSITHSLLFIAILSPLIGWIITKIHRNSLSIKPKQWALMVALSSLIHVGIDVFTGYGTGIFMPFDNARYSIATIAPFDLLFSFPLFLIAGYLLFTKHNQANRTLFSWLGVILSVLYFSYTVINKAYVNGLFEKTLMSQKRTFFQVKAYPQIPSNFVWLCIAKTSDGYWTGYYNQLKNNKIDFKFVPKNDYWLIDYENTPEIKRLKRFAKNQYSVSLINDSCIRFIVLRFGFFHKQNEDIPLMSYKILTNNSKIKIEKDPFRFDQ